MWRPRAASVLYGVALVAGYLGVVVWLTWPLAASIGTSLPAEGNDASHFDLYYSTWVLAHDSHALVGSTQLADANIYHPAPSALYYGPAALGALPLFAPVFLATGNPVLAINVTLLLGIALMGVSMHVVVRRWTGSHLAGVVGAATVVMNQWLVRGFVPGAPHWAALWWLPLIAFVAATRLDSMRAALWLVPLVALQCLTDLVYVVPAVVGPLAVLAVFQLVRVGTRAAGLRLIAVLALAALALVPVVRGYLEVQAANPDLASQTNWTDTEASFPSVLPDRLFHGRFPFVLTPVMLVLVALGTAAMVWRCRAGGRPPSPGGWAHGALWTLVGGSLSLTPLVLIGGRQFHTPIGVLADWFPSLQAIRVPNRLGIGGLVGLGILSGVAFAEISVQIRTHLRPGRLAPYASVALAAAVLFLVHRAYVDNYWKRRTMPSYRLREPPTIPRSFLPILGAGREPLLELPLNGPVNPPGHTLAMFHSIAHWRPLLNGYSSYWPAGFRERMVQASRLPNPDVLASLAESTGLSLIWVHSQWLRPKGRGAWEEPPRSDGKRRGLTLVARDGDELLFAVDPPPAGR